MSKSLGQEPTHEGVLGYDPIRSNFFVPDFQRINFIRITFYL